MHPDDIYLASFPFGDAPGMKLRPVLLLTDRLGSVPEVVVAYISSVIPAVLLPTDLVIDPVNPDGASTNLKTKSVLRLHKLATIHASAIVRRLGAISAKTSTEVDGKLRALFQL
ncbi:MAG TPA: type II toxin-antitoxin system PemK/MazF family toxin [Pirellulales bacterium]|nr:type II toxin-antitoxin system PemK/MazF family toxin [Pirellulales bacterium]